MSFKHYMIIPFQEFFLMQDLWGNEIGDDYIIVTIKSEEWLRPALSVLQW